MQVLDNKSYRDYLQTTPTTSLEEYTAVKEFKEENGLGIFDSVTAGFGGLVNEVHSSSIYYNNFHAQERQATVQKLINDGQDLSKYKRGLMFDYDAFAKDTGLVDDDLTIFRKKKEFLDSEREYYAELSERANGFGKFIGEMGAYISDPLVLATLPFGGLGLAGKSLGVTSRIIQGSARSAGVALATEIPIQFAVNNYKDMIGQPYDARDMITAITFATVGAGLFGGAAEGIAGYLGRNKKIAEDILDNREVPLEVNGKTFSTATPRTIREVYNEFKLEAQGKLIAIAGQRLPRAEVKSIKDQLHDLKYKKQQAESDAIIDLQKLRDKTNLEGLTPLQRGIAEATQQTTYKANKKAVAEQFDPMIKRLEDQLKKHDEGVQANKKLDRIEKGETIDIDAQAQKKIDDWVDKSNSVERQAIYNIEQLIEQIKGRKGFRAEETVLRSFVDLAQAGAKNADEVVTGILKAIDDEIAEISSDSGYLFNQVKQNSVKELEAIKGRIVDSSDVVDEVKKIMKENIDKDSKILDDIEADRVQRSSVTPRATADAPQKPNAPKAKTGDLEDQALKEMGLREAFNEEVAVYNSLETKHHIDIDADGNMAISQKADDEIASIDKDLDGLDSIMRCTRG